MDSLTTISAKEFYSMRKKAGVCTQCGREDAFTMAGRAKCAECAEKHRLHQAARLADPVKKKAAADRVKAKKEERAAAGLCTDCGRPTEPPYRWCPTCRAKGRARHHEAYVFTYRGLDGTCYMCNKAPAEKGKRLCRECADKCRANLVQANRDNADHTWRALDSIMFQTR